jgi:hypothetical protein
MIKAIFVGVVCVLLVAPLCAEESERITVFVGPQVRDGFADVDSGIRDSIKDIQQECQAAGWSVVQAADGAKLTLIVLGRGLPVKGDVGIGTGNTLAGTGSVFAMTVPNTVPTLTTSLRVGHYERTSSREGGNWRNAAKNVVEDLKAWIEANRAALK